MPNDDTQPSGFRPTRWSLVARAASPAEPAARAALEELCRVYWQPLHSFACRCGLAPADAEDATQSFFAEFLRHGRFAAADPQRGKLRTYLCSAFANHLRDLRRRASAQTRGGGQQHIALDATRDDGLGPIEPADPHTIEREFDRAWALATMDATIARLDADLTARGRGELLAQYRDFIGCDGAEGAGDYAATARKLGHTEGAVRVNVSRLRAEFRTALFATIADTLETPTDDAVRKEIRTLIEALAG
jgi:RNA polymerase sigma-70 factor (ECF subfamily)